MNRDIKNGSFGWYEKGAMKKIETLDRRQQASCKLIYIAICSISAKSMNSSEIECYKFDIARFASVNEKTVQRYLPELEKLGIVKVSPQDRKSNGKYDKMSIWLHKANPTVGQIEESSEPNFPRTFSELSDIREERKKERKKITSKEVKEKNIVPPKLEWIEQRMKEMNYLGFQAEAFFNHWGSVGWKKSNRQKIINWHLALATWNTNNKKWSKEIKTQLKPKKEFHSKIY